MSEIETGTASGFIQWKGTDVCIDLSCPCGVEGGGHFDGGFLYAWRCPNCGTVWKMPEHLTMRPATPEEIDSLSAVIMEPEP